MENVMHGQAHAAHHHEVELSIWPLVVALGGFLIPIAFMVAFSWGLQTIGLVLSGVAVVLLIVGLFGWTAEVHAKKEEAGFSKLAIIVFICSEVALFGGLFGGYMYTMFPAEVWPPANTPEGVPPLGLAMLLTVFLLSSSVTIHAAEDKIHEGNLGGFKSWMILTSLLGWGFVVGMAYEWYHLMHHHFSLSTNSYGTFFFLITGLHGSHVLVGLIMQLFLLILVSQGKIGPKKQTFTKATGLYWHFVDIVWLLVVSLIYVIPYFKVGQA